MRSFYSAMPFSNGESASADDKAQLVGMLGQIEYRAGDFYVPKRVVLHPEFPGALEAWDAAVREEIVEENKNGYSFRHRDGQSLRKSYRHNSRRSSASAALAGR